ncbi:MAG: Mrp/NBP35 family ATP-binding protein [Ferrimicrobium sp.]
MAKDIQEQVLERLGSLIDDELGASFQELGLVGPVSSRLRRVSAQLYYVGGAPEVAQRLQAEADAAVAELGSSVTVELLPLDPAGQAQLRERLMTPVMLEARTTRTPVFSLPGSTARVIGVSSGKGGVGKSSVTANMAAELARRGRRVGILDADVYGFSIPKLLGLTSMPRVIDDLILPPKAFGVKVMSLGFFVEEDTPVIWRGPMLHKTIEQFLVDVLWGELDYLLVDMPPGTGDVALSLQQFLPRSEIFVVTTPQSAAVRVAQRSALAAKKLKLPVRGVIENMSAFVTPEGERYAIFGSGGGARLAGDLGVELLGEVPLTMALREGGDQGIPAVIGAASDLASESLRELVDRLESLGPVRRYRSDLKVQAK